MNGPAPLFVLPETLPFPVVFKQVLMLVVEAGYHSIDAGSPADIADAYDGEKDAFDTDLANAIEEACTALNLGGSRRGQTGDWLGQLYDLAEEAGYAWPETEAADGADGAGGVS